MSDAAAERVVREQTVEGRLTRRFTLPVPVLIDWVTATHRKGIRRRIVVPTAEVLDISTGGMLVEAPSRPELVVGSTVELASDGHPATARVAHKHVALHPDKQLLGIEGFDDALHELVRALRG